MAGGRFRFEDLAPGFGAAAQGAEINLKRQRELAQEEAQAQKIGFENLLLREAAPFKAIQEAQKANIVREEVLKSGVASGVTAMTAEEAREVAKKAVEMGIVTEQMDPATKAKRIRENMKLLKEAIGRPTPAPKGKGRGPAAEEPDLEEEVTEVEEELQIEEQDPLQRAQNILIRAGSLSDAETDLLKQKAQAQTILAKENLKTINSLTLGGLEQGRKRGEQFKRSEDADVAAVTNAAGDIFKEQRKPRSEGKNLAFKADQAAWENFKKGPLKTAMDDFGITNLDQAVGDPTFRKMIQGIFDEMQTEEFKTRIRGSMGKFLTPLQLQGEGLRKFRKRQEKKPKPKESKAKFKRVPVFAEAKRVLREQEMNNLRARIQKASGRGATKKVMELLMERSDNALKANDMPVLTDAEKSRFRNEFGLGFK